MELTISLIWMAIECAGLFFILESFLQRKYKNRGDFILLLLLFFAVNVGFSILKIPGIFRQILSVLSFVSVALIAYRGKWLLQIVIALLAYIFLAIMDTLIVYGASALLQMAISELVWQKELYISIVTLGKLVFLLTTWILFRIRRSSNSHYNSKKWTILMLLFPAISLSMLMLLFDFCKSNASFASTILLFSGILGVANIGLMYVITLIEKDAHVQQKNTLLAQQMEIQTNSISALELAYRTQRTASHDYRQHLTTIQSLLSQNDPLSALNYTEELLRTQATRLLNVNTHHPIIDAILNQKYQSAQEKNISVHFQVNDFSDLRVQTSALVVLLSNLFDNAIEACEKHAGDRVINCTFLLSEDQIFLVISNTSSPVVISNNMVRTTKTPPHEHGFGLLNACHIIEQYNGNYSIGYKDGWFLFSAEMVNKNIEGD